MICANCSKLAVFNTRKACIKCGSAVFNNLCVLCEGCSNSEKLCSICLKKINTQNKSSGYRGCGRCGTSNDRNK